MLILKLFYALGALGWAVVLLNFLLGWVNRPTMLRFAWTLAAAAGFLFLFCRVVSIAPWLRYAMDSAMATGGVACGVTLAARYWNNPKVIE